MVPEAGRRTPVPAYSDGTVRVAIVGDASSPNVLRWTEGLRTAGASVAVASFERPPPSWSGEFLPLRLRQPGKGRYVLAWPAARRTLARWRPDVTAGYFVTGYGLLAALSAPGPLVQVGVGSDLLTTRPGTALARVVRFSLRRAGLVLVWSDELADAAVRLGADPDRLFVQPRGIPVAEFAALEPSDGLAVVSTRSLRPRYRVDVLVDAMTHLPRDATLTIIGDGPSRPRLEEQVRRLRLADRVTFLGTTPNRDLPALLSRHAVHVSLSPHDGVSASLLEAMASGLVPVAVDNAANRSWVDDGRTGVLLTTVTPGSVARAVLAAADPALRAAAGPVNREVVRRRADLHANARRTLERMRQLANSAASRPSDGRPARLGVLFLVRRLAMGGAERQLVLLALGLSERGHRVGVAVLHGGGVLEEPLRSGGVEFHDLSRQGSGLPARFRRLVALARRSDVDVLHGYLPGQNLLAALVRPFAPSLCIVWGVRSSRFAVSEYHNARARLSYRAEPLVSRFVDLVVTNSRAATEGINAGRYPPGRTVTIPNGIDAYHFRPDPHGGAAVRRGIGIPASVPLVVSVGRLDPVKGHDVLIEAAAILRPRHPDWRYLIIGQGPDELRARLDRAADALGVADRFHWRPHEVDLRPFYAAADLVCQPSRAEGFPNVVAEAMASGTPCVVTAVGDVEDIVGDAGVVVPVGDAAALAAGIEEGLALPPSTGPRARARIEERYSVAAMVERTEAALLVAAARRRSR